MKNTLSLSRMFAFTLLLVHAFGLYASSALLHANNALAADDATGFVEQKHREVRAALSSKGSDATVSEKLNGILDTFVDYEALAKDSLRDHWGSKTPAQRQEFVKLLKKLIQRNYEKNIKRTLSFSINYQPAQQAAGNTLVRTVARPTQKKRAEPVQIDYTLTKNASSEWRVIDIKTDDVSLVDNYRNQFNKIIKKSGWDGLIQRMRERLEKGTS